MARNTWPYLERRCAEVIWIPGWKKKSPVTSAELQVQSGGDTGPRFWRGRNAD